MNMELTNIFQKGLEKIAFMQENLQGDFPHITEKGKWHTNANGHWTGGFWTGLLWLEALYTQNNTEQKATALKQVKKLAVRMNDNKTHDMGFIFGPSCVMGNHIEPDGKLVEMAIAGAHNMEDLFEEKTGLVLAWDEPGYEGVAIVDTIMNVPLMIWTAKQENDQTLYNKGITVANHIRENHVRPDYSIYHVVRWDTKTYEIVERSTHQGFNADSCWSRGQAWALYGLANMYRYTSKEEYLETSQNLATYFWEHLDDNLYLPRWDFIFKNNQEEPLDAAAACIAASGMLLLSKMLEQNDRSNESKLWKERAEKIIESLVKYCFYKNREEYGLIEHVTVDKPRNSGVNESSMYGDYYFMESLYRLINYDNKKMIDILY
ncbi:MAG TPA: glycoside hydrolase family 88 protein [Hanamia sp.]|nr:glycoside hydrolase family 88 protein [Hanamia sp.]